VGRLRERSLPRADGGVRAEAGLGFRGRRRGG
jgi:hypothetical protein